MTARGLPRADLGQRLEVLPWIALAGLTGATLAFLPALAVPVLVVVALIVLSAITPLAALVATLALAPLRTLIATEAAFQLPLDIGQLSLLAFLGVHAVHQAARRDTVLPGQWSPVFTYIALFLAAGALTAFSAWSMGAWLNEWLKWAQILALAAVVFAFGGADRWRWILFALTLAAALNAVIGLYEFFGGSGALHLVINNRFFRAFGTFGQPNPFGGFMGLVAPLALMAALGHASALWTRWRSTRRLDGSLVAPLLWYGSASILLSIGVVISWSRGAWLAFGVACVVALMALPRRWAYSVALLAVVGGLGAFLWLTGRVPATIATRVESATRELFAFTDVRGVDITPENYAVVERLAHWQAALGMSRDYPWLGVGLGNYEIAYPTYRLINWKFPLGHAHNFYLNVFAEAGMIGLTAYIILWAGILHLTWRARAHPDPVARCVVVGLLGTWTYLSVHSLTDNLYVNNLFVHLGVMLGLLAVLYREACTYKRLRMP